ncbi:alpha/beta fold hydrolase [Vibrio sp. WXL210]|uniref:alpha/beta fold hydrolase n=1 Tax=Vibrio sp. WXL210 TaxID=3450709 RepID=UPI003EC53E63
MVPIVLLRGLLRESGHWSELVTEMKTHNPYIDLITPDVKGNGALYQERSPSSVEAMLPSVLEQLPSDCQRYHLVAISMGSMLASVWAKRYPHCVASLTLINPSFARFSPPWERINLTKLVAILASRLKGQESFQTKLLDYTYPEHRTKPTVLANHIALAERHPVSMRNAIYQLLAAARFRGFASAPNCPCQVIVSVDDQLVFSLAGKRIATAWQVPLKTFESNAHDLPLAEPEALTAHLLSWTEQPTGSAFAD